MILDAVLLAGLFAVDLFFLGFASKGSLLILYIKRGELLFRDQLNIILSDFKEGFWLQYFQNLFAVYFVVITRVLYSSANNLSPKKTVSSRKNLSTPK